MFKQILLVVLGFALLNVAVHAQYSSPAPPPPSPSPPPCPLPANMYPPDCPTGLNFTDVDILNFALNLECLEAEFYSWAAYGHGLSAARLGGGPGSIGGMKANLSDEAQKFATELAIEEGKHVDFLRMNLGPKAVACPLMDIGQSWVKLANLAFNKTVTPSFSPYLNDLFFALGVYTFEDVGVSAYNGAAPFIQSKTYLAAGASILAVEAYHAGAVRLVLADMANTSTPYGVNVGAITDAIATLRNNLGNPGMLKDVGVVNPDGTVQVTDASPDFALAFARLPQQVSKIVAAFFPNGLNGYFM